MIHQARTPCSSAVCGETIQPNLLCIKQISGDLSSEKFTLKGLGLKLKGLGLKELLLLARRYAAIYSMSLKECISPKENMQLYT